MEIWQIIAISIMAFLVKLDHKGPQIVIYNSVFWGGLAGLVMGDFRMGLVIGGTFQLMSLGVTSIGGSSVPDYQIGAIISTAIAVSTGQGVEMGITIGLPVAMACIQLAVPQNLLDGYLVRKAQKYCNKGEFRKMNAMIWLCIPGTGLSTAIPAFIAVAFGPMVVEMAYKGGWRLMNEFEEKLSVFTDATGALGLTVVGSMFTRVVSIHTPLTFVSGTVTKSIQDVMDGIVPSLLPVIAAMLVMAF